MILSIIYDYRQISEGWDDAEFVEKVAAVWTVALDVFAPVLMVGTLVVTTEIANGGPLIYSAFPIGGGVLLMASVLLRDTILSYLEKRYDDGAES